MLAVEFDAVTGRVCATGPVAAVPKLRSATPRSGWLAMPDEQSGGGNSEGGIHTGICEGEHLKVQALRIKAMTLCRVIERFRRHKSHRAAGLERVLADSQQQQTQGSAPALSAGAFVRRNRRAAWSLAHRQAAPPSCLTLSGAPCARSYAAAENSSSRSDRRTANWSAMALGLAMGWKAAGKRSVIGLRGWKSWNG
jgi:hypothetical protein